MKKIVVFLAAMTFMEGLSFAESAEDKIPGMSGKIEIMEGLGLIDQPEAIRHVVRSRKNQTPKKEAPHGGQNAHLAGLDSVDN